MLGVVVPPVSEGVTFRLLRWRKLKAPLEETGRPLASTEALEPCPFGEDIPVGARLVEEVDADPSSLCGGAGALDARGAADGKANPLGDRGDSGSSLGVKRTGFCRGERDNWASWAEGLGESL